MRAIVFFCDLERPRWWRRFLRPGFRHCLALLETAMPDHWIEVDPLAHMTGVRLWWPFDHKHIAVNIIPRATAAVEIDVPDEAPKIARWLWPATCVETVKRIVGLRDYWAITPYQLFRRLSAVPGATVHRNERGSAS